MKEATPKANEPARQTAAQTGSKSANGALIQTLESIHRAINSRVPLTQAFESASQCEANTGSSSDDGGVVGVDASDTSSNRGESGLPLAILLIEMDSPRPVIACVLSAVELIEDVQRCQA